MTPSRLGALLVATLVGTPALLASTAIATRMRWAGYEIPGAPLVGKFWAPWDALLWWLDWGPEYSDLFLEGCMWSFAPVAVIGGALAFRFYQGEFGGLRVSSPERDEHLGKARDLLRSPQVATAGDGVVIGKNGDEIVRVTDDKHVLIVGPSDSGKGVGHVIPTMLEHRGSMVVHDPKHELARIVGRYRASLGPTWIFDPTDRWCDHYNPLRAVRGGDHLHGDCHALATLIGRTGDADDPVWEIAATQLITALMLVAFEHGKPQLSYVHSLMFQICQGVYPPTRNAFAVRCFAAHRADHDKIRTSVNFQLRGSMEFMDDPVVQEVTDDSAFNAGDLFCGAQPTTIYITVPPADRDRLTALMRVMMQAMLYTGLHAPTHVADGRAKTRRTMLLFDEFPTLRKMSFLETNIAECRGYGIRCVLVCQDIAQIERAYGQNQAITSNCGTIALTPGFSQTSLEVIGDWAGETLRTHRSRGRETFRPMSVRTGESETHGPVLFAGDMMARAENEVLVFRTGLARPVYLRKVRYFREPRWQGLYDGRATP